MLKRRIGMSLFGVVVCAISVGIFKLAAFGVDPFQTLMGGLDKAIPIKFGTLYVIVNVVLLSFSLITDRHLIGIATFINLFLLGYITQFTYDFLVKTFPNPGMPLRIGSILVGIVIICIGSAFYMTADLGVSTYDAIAIVMANKWKWGKFKYIRVITDFVCVASGAAIFMLAGGTFNELTAVIGVGTIITAFFMGPLIEYFSEKLARPLIKKAD